MSKTTVGKGYRFSPLEEFSKPVYQVFDCEAMETFKRHQNRALSAPAVSTQECSGKLNVELNNVTPYLNDNQVNSQG